MNSYVLRIVGELLCPLRQVVLIAGNYGRIKEVYLRPVNATLPRRSGNQNVTEQRPILSYMPDNSGLEF